MSWNKVHCMKKSAKLLKTSQECHETDSTDLNLDCVNTQFVKDTIAQTFRTNPRLTALSSKADEDTSGVVSTGASSIKSAKDSYPAEERLEESVATLAGRQRGGTAE